MTWTPYRRDGAGRLENLAYDRAERDHARENAVDFPYRYDQSKVDRVVEFFHRYCRFTKDRWLGKEFILEPYQLFCISEVFGWLNVDDGTRRFRTMWLELGRKAGKTEVGGALGLYLLAGDGCQTPEIYSTATVRQQATRSFLVGAEMVNMTSLKRLVKPSVATKSTERWQITCPKNRGKWIPLAADSGTLDSLNVQGHIIDEVHEHKDHLVWVKVDGGMAAREQPLTVAITTAGTNDQTMIGWQKHDLAVKVLEGSLQDETFFAFVATADKGLAVDDEKAWIQANPSYPSHPSKKFMTQNALRAKNEPSFVADFRRFHLNQWVESMDSAINMDDWAACQNNITVESLRGMPCALGLDLSLSGDLSSLAGVFFLLDGRVAVLSKSYMPQETIDRHAKAGRRYYRQWVEQGWLTEIPGRIIDQGVIERDILEWTRLYSVGKVGYDPAKATDLTTRLSDQHGLTMIEVRQGYISMNAPSRIFESHVLAHRVVHFNNPILTFAVRNLVFVKDTGKGSALIKPDRTSELNKIDPVAAVIDALAVGSPDPAGNYIIVNGEKISW